MTVRNSRKHGLTGVLTMDCFQRSRVNLDLPLRHRVLPGRDVSHALRRVGGTRVVVHGGHGTYPSATPWYGSGHPPTGSKYRKLGKNKGNL